MIIRKAFLHKAVSAACALFAAGTIFAADRAIRDYANTIWLAKPVETKAETKKK